MPDLSRSDRLQAILDKADEAACAKFFDGATEAERRAVAKTAIDCYKRFKKPEPGMPSYHPNPRLPAAGIAVLATASLSELKPFGWRLLPDAKTAFAVLTARRPEWLSEYIDWLLGETAFCWPLARALIRRKLCRRPTHENYTLGMIISIDGWRLGHLHVDEPQKSVGASLRADPDLLQDEIWELFRVEGQGELTLAAHDKYIAQKDTDYGWAGALAALSKTGEVSRDRLLDESLEALNRGFSQFRVAWFSQFHELLEPTVKERLKRQDKYLVLLASAIPPTVTFALDALDAIDKEKPLPAEALIEALQPVLLARQKGTARRAVQWLDRLATREPACASPAAGAAAQALAHESADVQKAAIEVLEKHGSPSDAGLKKQVASAASGVAASLRKRLDKWLGGGAAEKPAPPAKSAAKAKAGGGLADLERQAAALPAKWSKLAGIPPLLAAAKKGQLEIAALTFGPLDVPRLDPAAALQPVQTIDEWIDVCAHFLETPDEIDEGERVLEGLSRLCGQSLNDLARELGPLKKRVDKLYRSHCGPFLGVSLRDDVCGIVRAWTTGETITGVRKKTEHGSLAWFYSDKERPVWVGSEPPAHLVITQRSQQLAERAAQRLARPLLSAATHRGGWLDPLVFADRLLAWEKLGEEPPHCDAIVALLRLAPDNRAAALKRLGKLKGELADAARYALGAEKPAIGKTVALWIAAARARDPQADDPLVEKKFPDLGPGGGTAARYEWSFRPGSHTHAGKTYHFVRYRLEIEPKMPKQVESDLPTVLMNRLPEYVSRGEAAEIRWRASLWPAGREAHLVRGVRLLANNVDWSEAEWGNKVFLEPLLAPDEPLGELARVALCLGLSAKEPGEHTLAVDALIAAIADGRVDGQNLAPTLAKLLTTGDIKPGRWAKVFGDVARVSPLHGHIVQLMLENTLAAAGQALADPPKDLHHVLELLIELHAESGTAIESKSVRDALTNITASGKAGKAAKALLAVTGENSGGDDSEPIRAALAGRIERAKRWAAGSS
ncbi:MAG TPA: DUF6493 family protein [Pirellulaceae bacterium]|nr:DUF6493 family protein [Pirellulaceae bacterium]